MSKAEKTSKKINTDFSFYGNEDKEPSKWITGGLQKFIIVFSVAWFAIVAVYITKFFGWSNLFSMVPNEFSGFMASITLPLAIIWVIMAYIDRGANFRKETQMLQQSLNQIIFPDSNGSAATKMISEAIKTQVMDLKSATRDACAQADVIKRDLSAKVEDLNNLTTALQNYAAQALPNINEEIREISDNFHQITERATTSMADFRVNTLQMREDSESLVNILKPMVNEMVTAAQRVMEVVNVNNENIAKAQEQLSKYSETSRLAIGNIIESWSEKGENLQRAFLRTAENCEDLFHRLDSGISHIENSINEQKKVLETQSDLLTKNSSYLDNKLGEYGKLISLEVEAMVNRSGTLEENIKTQIKGIREAATQMSEMFIHLGEEMVSKRKLLEDESRIVTGNIKETISGLTTEMNRLKEFYDATQNKNGEMNRIFSTLSAGLKEAEKSLNDSVGQFSVKTENIVGKFQTLNNQVAGNISKLVDSSNSMTQQSQSNAALLSEQDEYIKKALSNLKNITGQISNLNNDLNNTGDQIGKTLQTYEKTMNNFGAKIVEHFDQLGNKYTQTKEKMQEVEQKINTAGLDSFMKTSSTIISELEAVSIDINAVFEKADKDLWKKYYDGDHGAFVRYLAKNMTKKEIVSLQNSYEKKAEFRIIVDKYLEDFNRLIAAARESEYAGILLSVISGSDIGKVYYVLARALGKLN